MMAVAESLGAAQLASACGSYIAQNADFILLSSATQAVKARSALAEDGSSMLGSRWTSEQQRIGFSVQRQQKHAEVMRKFRILQLQEQALASTPEGRAARMAQLHPEWEGEDDTAHWLGLDTEFAGATHTSRAPAAGDDLGMSSDEE